MNDLLTQQLEEVLRHAAGSRGLACEGQLRAAAGTLSRAASADISATTVVGALGADDVSQFDALVASIADEYNLDVRVHHQVGAFSVRFTRRPRPAPAPVASPSRAGLGSWLARVGLRSPAGT
jgi:hypothetical protein